MKNFTDKIRVQIAECRSAETDLAKVQNQLAALQAEIVANESDVARAPAGAFEKLLAKLEAQRKAGAELEYRVALTERHVTRLQSGLATAARKLVDDTKSATGVMRLRIHGEIRRRLSPFVEPRLAQATVQPSRIRPLVKLQKIAASLDGLIPRLSSHCSTASAAIADKCALFAATCSELEAHLNPTKP